MAHHRSPRASGENTSAETAKELSQDLDSPEPESPAPGEEKRMFRTPGFQRMRVEWNGDDAMVLYQATEAVDKKILSTFTDAYQLMNSLFDIVRNPELDEDGEPKKDERGFVIWKRSIGGGWDEDFTRLTAKQKEDFLFRITTRLFDWEQRSVDLWGEAMFARAQWEERFSIDFDAPMAGTVDDRTAVGRIGSMDERYFAVYCTLLSRRADAIVRVMSLLGQRLKDALSS